MFKFLKKISVGSFNYFRETFLELRKIVWPTPDSVLASTKVVVISTIVVALVLGLVDFVFLKLIDFLL